MNSRTTFVLMVFLFLAALAMPAWRAVLEPPVSVIGGPEPEQRGRATVVWISVDGVRPDYIERGETPFLDRLMKEGAYSLALEPVFPSLTFPSHVSQATGVTAEKHGVMGNSFIDSSDWHHHRYPHRARLMEAEPIWLTAPRQGVRTVVYDWPLSHEQRGGVRADRFGMRFDGRLTDRERLQQVLDAWEIDEHQQPLRLLMGYVVGPDKPGHAFGPDAREPVEELERVDSLLAEFAEEAVRLWRRTRGPDDELYLLISTDHGMSNVTKLVNLHSLAGIGGEESFATTTSGNVGHIFFTDRDEDAASPPEHVEARLNAIVAAVNEHAFAKAYRRENLPREWGFAHPRRTGDIVVVLDSGGTFSTRPKQVSDSIENYHGPLGMHGYDPRKNAEMNGILILWRAESPLGGIDLGPIHSLQLHATAAKLLGIEPADGARKDGISIQPAAR